MKKNPEKVKRIKEKFNEILELPKELLFNVPRMVVLGNEQVLIENYSGIVEYEDNLIRLSNNINIYGMNLVVDEITAEDIMIVGKISSIEFDS